MQQMDRDRDKNGRPNPSSHSLLEKQLEEILRNTERSHRRQLFWRRVRGFARTAVRPATRGRASIAGRLMAVGLGLCLLAMLISPAARGLAAFLVLAGVILVISPVFLGLGRRGRGGIGEERLWRGRVIRYPDNTAWGAGRAWVQQWWRRMRGGPPRRGG